MYHAKYLEAFKFYGRSMFMIRRSCPLDNTGRSRAVMGTKVERECLMPCLFTYLLIYLSSTAVLVSRRKEAWAALPSLEWDLLVGFMTCLWFSSSLFPRRVCACGL